MSTASLAAAAAPLATVAFVMSVTPGPNNIMLLNSGARFGLRRTVPHLVGIGVGYLFVLLLAAAGVAQFLLALPAAQRALSLACAAYLLWLGWQMLRIGPGPAAPDAPGTAARPLRWLEAALLQFANPKGWAAAAALMTIGSHGDGTVWRKLALPLALASIINVPCTMLWAWAGAGMRQLFDGGRSESLVRLLMALLIAATAIWMLLP